MVFGVFAYWIEEKKINDKLIAADHNSKFIIKYVHTWMYMRAKSSVDYSKICLSLSHRHSFLPLSLCQLDARVRAVKLKKAQTNDSVFPLLHFVLSF